MLRYMSCYLLNGLERVEIEEAVVRKCDKPDEETQGTLWECLSSFSNDKKKRNNNLEIVEGRVKSVHQVIVPNRN